MCTEQSLAQCATSAPPPLEPEITPPASMTIRRSLPAGRLAGLSTDSPPDPHLLAILARHRKDAYRHSADQLGIALTRLDVDVSVSSGTIVPVSGASPDDESPGKAGRRLTVTVHLTAAGRASELLLLQWAVERRNPLAELGGTGIPAHNG
ncbi:MAG TPA: hypothetical protein VK943_16310 [Arenibaculum sp.]|nr:hypothetical protein [Arenibaculum sp.]